MESSEVEERFVLIAIYEYLDRVLWDAASGMLPEEYYATAEEPILTGDIGERVEEFLGELRDPVALVTVSF